MTPFTKIVEEQLKAAMARGEFDNLSGMGKPLPNDPLDHLPESFRMAFRIMRNAGYSEDEAKYLVDMHETKLQLLSTEDELDKVKYQKRLDEKQVQYQQYLSKKKIRTNSDTFKAYHQKIYDTFNH
ncbi:DUF1992 domain-containing protein [Mangrovibacillus cuniculi]|uniref:DUF1992 domain-containing protein n=1 Tax=Mangrovibacillus cuniculi TaxID=2593652 RepID=A0A7S8C986_9BACI|nr:DUF1992 domain-containing protein [Mangrovibacillus cuniculi]QPC45750.1 DUF1992 domain-containing protein [Mangrovibacillus cuniculi]